jgi:hypothetical protein
VSEVVADFTFFPPIGRDREPLITNVIFTDNHADEQPLRSVRFRYIEQRLALIARHAGRASSHRAMFVTRIAGSFVIARNTAFTYKSKPVDVKQIGRELKVRVGGERSARQ